MPNSTLGALLHWSEGGSSAGNSQPSGNYSRLTELERFFEQPYMGSWRRQQGNEALHERETMAGQELLSRAAMQRQQERDRTRERDRERGQEQDRQQRRRGLEQYTGLDNFIEETQAQRLAATTSMLNRQQRQQQHPTAYQPELFYSNRNNINGANRSRHHQAANQARIDTSLEDRLKGLIDVGKIGPMEYSSWMRGGVKFRAPKSLTLEKYRTLKLPSMGLTMVNLRSAELGHYHDGVVNGKVTWAAAEEQEDAPDSPDMTFSFTGKIFDEKTCAEMTPKTIVNDFIRPFKKILNIDILEDYTQDGYILMLWYVGSSKPMCVCMRRSDGLLTGAGQELSSSMRTTFVLLPSGPFMSPVYTWQ